MSKFTNIGRKRSNIVRISVTLGVMLFSVDSFALNTITAIEVNDLEVGNYEIQLRMSRPLETEPDSFVLKSPASIVVDLKNTLIGFDNQPIIINGTPIYNIRSIESDNRTRIVIGLTAEAVYDVKSVNDVTYITVNSSLASSRVDEEESTRLGEDSVDSEEPVSGAEPENLTKFSDDRKRILNFNFRRNKLGHGQVHIRYNGKNAQINVLEEGRYIYVDFQGFQIADDLIKIFDVRDFATPVSTVEFLRSQSTRSVRMVVTPIDSLYEQFGYQASNTFTLELKPITQEQLSQLEIKKEGYRGEKISLDFQNIDVRTVLTRLADFTDNNIIVSDSVEGSVTMRLKSVPWDQALDQILRSKGLAKVQDNNVILVAPISEIANRQRLELESQQQSRELAPIRSEFFQINYANASDVSGIVSGENGLISDRGSVTVDERTNLLIIQETSEKLEEIRSVINRIDIPVRQVLIDSRIVVASDNFTSEIGGRFGFARNEQNPAGDNLVSTGGSLGGLVNYSFNPFSAGAATDEIELDDILNVSLPATASTAGSIAIGLQGRNLGLDGYLLGLELSAMSSEGRGEIVSSPRVITTNKQEASIEQGVEIPYQEASSSGATSVSFKKAVLALRVTPQITPNDQILMTLNLKNDSVGDVFAGIPSINTREVTTNVVVNNGETIVLGGIYEQTRNNQVAKVPFFGDIPLLKVFFRRKTTSDRKNELLLFVTPSIIRQQFGS